MNSDKDPDDPTRSVEPWGVGCYIPSDHNFQGALSTDPGFASGTVDVWLTPNVMPRSGSHITGRWSCTD